MIMNTRQTNVRKLPRRQPGNRSYLKRDYVLIAPQGIIKRQIALVKPLVGNVISVITRFGGKRGYADMRICGYADMRVCVYAGMRICGYADMRVRRTGLITNRFQKLINNSCEHKKS